MASSTRCDVALVPSHIPQRLPGAIVAAIDVLRATTTIAYALQNGARSVIPCEEPADAQAVRRRLGDGCILGGERDSVGIAGFDLDNSPMSYTRERVAGQTVAFTTTNGTRALRRAIDASPAEIVCASFSNLSAIVEYVRNRNPLNVLLACAGSEGEVALEDVLAAGAIAERLAARMPAIELTDAAKAAVLAYQSAAIDLPSSIAASEHAQALLRAGFSGDIEIAAQLDSTSVVPVVRDGAIVRA